MGKKKRIAAVMSVILVCILLITEFPKIINAAELFGTQEQTEVREETDAEEDTGEQETGEETGKVEEQLSQDEENTETVKENVIPNKKPEEEQKTEQSVSKESSDNEDNSSGLKKITNQQSSPLNRTTAAASADIVAPVGKDDPMYWMGQREAGDENRAMVWFGKYWFDANSLVSNKAPVLWRTLRSDGQGNYGGAVTLLSEYGLNSIWFSNDALKGTYNQFWCAPGKTSRASSELRAWMNGYGTGAMDPDYAGQTGWYSMDGTNSSMVGYNTAANANATSYRNSFYSNAFNEQEKNIIMQTKISGEKGSLDNETGKDIGATVSDKIFALSGYNLSATDMPLDRSQYDNEIYLKPGADSMCYPTYFLDSRYKNNIRNILGATYANCAGDDWWFRSPVTGKGRVTFNNYCSRGQAKASSFAPKKFTTSEAYYYTTPKMARPALNLEPTSVVFTPAAKSVLNPNDFTSFRSYGLTPTDTFTDSKVIGLEESNGISAGAYEVSGFNAPAYGQGACYRVFRRTTENSGLSIDNGTDETKIAVGYPEGAAGQYISAMVVTENGEKWTGRIKKIPDDKSGVVEFSLPQRTPGTSASNVVRVFAWRESEETETACTPNVAQLTITEAPSIKITYAQGGGTAGAKSMKTQSVVAGSKFTLHPCTFQSLTTTGERRYLKYWQDQNKNCYGEEEILTAQSDLQLKAIWTDKTCQTVFNAGLGSGEPIKMPRGEGGRFKMPDCPFTPPADGEFLEWNTSSNGRGTSYEPGEQVVLDDGKTTTTFYAIYGKKCTVTYNANGSNEDNMTQIAEEGAQITLKDSGFTRKGYTLKGWNTAANGTGTPYAKAASIKLSNNLTLYAQWDGIPYTVSFDAKGGLGTLPNDITPVYYGTEVTIPETNLTKSQCKFDGWTLSSDGTGTVYKKGDTITIDDNFSSATPNYLYGKWSSAENYKLTYNLNKPAGVIDSAIDGQIAPANTSCYNDGINTKIKAAEAGVKIKGYKFKGWSPNALTPPLSDGLIAPEDEVTVTSDRSLHAIWATADQWKVTYSGPDTGVNGLFPTDNGTYYDDGFTYTTTVKKNAQTRPGYTFAGWSTEEDSDTVVYQPEAQMTVTGNTTLYAVWQPNTCTVTYDRNADKGSGNPPDKQTGNYGTEFTAAAAPEDMTNPGKKFNGWNTKPDGGEGGTEYTAGGSYKFTADITLYAQWTDSKYEFVFDSNDANKGEAPESIKASYGDEVTMPETGILKKQYVFDGWAESKDGTGKCYAAKSSVKIDDTFTEGTINLFAKWKDAEIYNLSYDTNAGTDTVTGTLPDAVNYYGDGIDNVIFLSDVSPVRKGYVFSGWSTTKKGKAEYQPGQKITLSETTTLYAVWTAGQYSLIYHFNGGDDTQHGNLPATVTGGPETTGIKAASQGDLKREHYKFIGWNTTKEGDGTTYLPDAAVKLNENINLYAQWQIQKEATLTYSKNCLDAQTLVPDPDKGHYDDGINHETVISSNIPIRLGYSFKGWSTDSNASPQDENLLKGGDKITVTSDTTIYAIWDMGNYTLTYDKNVSETDSDQIQGVWPEDEEGTVNNSVTLNDGLGIKREHYTLKEWNTKADGSGSIYKLGAAFTLGADVTLYAIWEPDSYTIHYETGSDFVTGKAPDDYTGKYKTSYQAAQGNGMTKNGAVFTGWNDMKKIGRAHV